MRYQWRPMTRQDMPRVMQIAAQVHAGYFEQEQVFADRLAVFPSGCWLAVADDVMQEACGYAIAHPARIGAPPPLNTRLPSLDRQADALHLHDVALLPAARGTGLGQALLVRLVQVMQAQGLAHASLVAVHDSGPYWRARGFAEHPRVSAVLVQALASYGEGARYMTASGLAA